MRQLRVVVLALLVLVVPTFALGGEEEPSGPATLSVSASLAGCGVANAAIVCQIDTSWSSLEGADYYTVSVTRPDGSVVDLGQSDGTSRGIFVPYVGPGSYSVQVAAWGTPPGENEPEVLVREKALSSDGGDGGVAVEASAQGADPAGDGRDAVAPGVDGTDEPGTGPEAPVTDPPCEEPDAEEDPDGDDPDGNGDQPAAESAPATASDELAPEDEPEGDEPVCAAP